MNEINEQKSRRVILKSSQLPVYRQVADHLEKDVMEQRKAGGKIALPSESELANEFGVSRVTIRQSLDRLHFKGLIYREKGRGSYIRSSYLNGITGLGSFSNEVARSGSKPNSQLIQFKKVDSLPDGMLRHIVRPLTADQSYHLISRVRLVDDAPVAKEDAHIPSNLFPEMQREDIETGSLYAVMRDKWGHEPAWADAAIEPGVADDELAEQLNIAPGSPVVVAWRVTSSEQDEVLEYVRSVYRGDGFALSINRHKIG